MRHKSQARSLSIDVLRRMSSKHKNSTGVLTGSDIISADAVHLSDLSSRVVRLI